MKEETSWCVALTGTVQRLFCFVYYLEPQLMKLLNPGGGAKFEIGSSSELVFAKLNRLLVRPEYCILDSISSTV